MMRSYWRAMCLFVVLLSLAAVRPSLSPPARATPLECGERFQCPMADAVVRLPANRASAVIIENGKNYTVILGAAHAFDANTSELGQYVSIDVPYEMGKTGRHEWGILLAVDYQADLALIWLDAHTRCAFHIADNTPNDSAEAWSIGYDSLNWPSVIDKTTIVGMTNKFSRPYLMTEHTVVGGRSGGAIVDVKTNRLVAIVYGCESGGQRRGLGNPLSAIKSFMQENADELAKRRAAAKERYKK